MILSNCLCSLTVQSSSPEFSDFFFSSRRRHTRCTLGTGVQTCALPISTSARVACRRQNEPITRQHRSRGVALHKIGKAACQWIACGTPGNDEPLPQRLMRRVRDQSLAAPGRSEDRRVGKGCVRTCRAGWSPYNYKKKDSNYSYT